MLMIRFIILALIFATGCSSTRQRQQSFPHLVKLSPPVESRAEPSKVYINGVKLINIKQQKALLISGDFANGCTHLKTVSHAISDDSLHVSLTAWQPADKLCTQALQPFSFVYDKIPGKRLQHYNSIVINHTTLQIKQP